ncbi:hypothetical protein GUJ93_ZPchr0013g34462 [Zizania palustris]|uniref:FLZ-type domain-containing protein n=1 Tax=Zizania palustris TaxID=103762 RepID=A0A8J5WSZ7_ZIZPA|nr:hypothetical protein GUJ93_ZPchr0013g34462 [Zizania palustris]
MFEDLVDFLKEIGRSFCCGVGINDWFSPCSSVLTGAIGLGELEMSRFVKVASRFFLVEEDNGCGDDDGDYHYLDACFLCKWDITFNRHIFMYSDDCRRDQMDMDATLAAVRRELGYGGGPRGDHVAPTVADLTMHATPAVSG